VGRCEPVAARSVEDVIVAEDPNTIAAVIVEPIGNTGGIITPTVEYFQMLRDICTRRNVLLIFDEIITGIAKTGNMFAAQTYGVTPDILCLGKGISNGALPLAAMMTREDLATSFDGEQTDAKFFAHGHTFAGNPLASAVGIAVLEEILEKRSLSKGNPSRRVSATPARGLETDGSGSRDSWQRNSVRCRTGA